jgi:hypothetical protein
VTGDALDYRAATVEAVADEVAAMLHDDALFYDLSRRGGPDWREGDHVYAAVRTAVYRRLGLVEVAEVVEALRDAHRHDSAADAVEYVSELAGGWCAEDDEVLQAEAAADLPEVSYLGQTCQTDEDR